MAGRGSASSRNAREHGELRRWLRVPRGFGLPRWVAPRLGETLRAAIARREGVALDAVTYGVIDLETTGVGLRSGILEIGLVVQRGGRTLERFATLVNTGDWIPAAITSLTGISDEMLEGAPPAEGALARLEGILRAHAVSALVAHNAPFDRAFLERAWRAREQPTPLPPFLCSLRLARRLVRAPGYDLDVLAAQLGIPVVVRHRALPDAEIAASLWWELLLRARVQGIHTLEELETLARPRRSRRPPPRRRVVALAAPAGE